MPLSNLTILACPPIWIRSLLDPSLLVWFSFTTSILFPYWCQQCYSSAWRIPSGISVMAILWNCLRNLSHYMLRVERGRKQRQILIYWWINVSQGLRILVQNFIELLLKTLSVSSIVSIWLNSDDTYNHFLCLNIAHQPQPHPYPEDQAFELNGKIVTWVTWLQNLMQKICGGTTCWNCIGNWMYKHNDNEFGKNFDVKIWHPTGLSLKVSAKG